MSLSDHSGEEQQINHDPIRSPLAPSYAPLHQHLKGGGDAIQGPDMNPRHGDKNRHSPPFLRKDPFLAPSNSGCYGLLGSMVYSRCEGTKPLSHPVKVARGGRMYGEGRAAVVPDEMSLLRWPRSGDWQVATHSTADRPGGLWGSYILDHVWISVFVTIAGYIEWLGEQEGYGHIRFWATVKSGTNYGLKRALLTLNVSCEDLLRAANTASSTYKMFTFWNT